MMSQQPCPTNQTPDRPCLAHDDSPWDRRLGPLIPWVVLVGIAARLAQYLACNSLWGDEGFLLLNLQHYDLHRLLTGRLDYVSQALGYPTATQAAPPLFLLILKVISDTLGQSEYAMRFLPLLMGILCLPAFAILARRLLPPAIAFFLIAFLACSDKLILQAATVKQYSGDVLIATILLLIAFARRPQCPMRRLMLAAVFTAPILWFSHTAIFIFAALSLASLPIFARRGAMGWVKYLAVNLLVFVSFAMLWWFSIRAQRDPYLDEFWARGFADYSRPLRWPLWLAENLVELLTYALRPLGLLLLVPLAFGVVDLCRLRRFDLLMTLGGPFLLVVVAALLHQYPLAAQRITMFLIPAEYLLAGYGLLAMRRLLPRLWNLLWWALPACILTALLVRCAYELMIVQPGTQLRPAIEHLRARRQPGEPVYIIGESFSATFLCYWPDPDPLIKLAADPRLAAAPIPDEHFWLLLRLEPRRPDRAKGLLNPPNAALDPSASFRDSYEGCALHFRPRKDAK
jgi:hypothetical protein